MDNARDRAAELFGTAACGLYEQCLEHGAYRWVDVRSYRDLADGSAAFDMLSRYFDSD